MNVLKTLFPFISAAASLGGPLGTMAANALGQALGAKVSDPSPAGLTKMLSGATPDQLLAAQTAEQNFQVQMAKLGFDDAEAMERMGDEDRNSARNREIQVKDKIPAVLAIAVTLGFFGLIALMMKYSPPPANKDSLVLMLGSLGTAWISIVGYYFGSSAGSQKKDATIQNLSK
jgi:hypothetical protein